MKLTEEQLKNLIKKSVKKALNEGFAEGNDDPQRSGRTNARSIVESLINYIYSHYATAYYLRREIEKDGFYGSVDGKYGKYLYDQIPYEIESVFREAIDMIESSVDAAENALTAVLQTDLVDEYDKETIQKAINAKTSYRPKF